MSIPGICLIVITFLTSSNAAFARQTAPPTAAPRVVRFDGVTTADAAGPRTARLALFDADESGTLLWEETQVVPVDAQGRYAVLVGAGSGDGLPLDVLAGAAPRWLEVRFAGQASAVRVLLTSVPYALRAADADTLGGLPASAFLRAPEPASGHDGRASDAGSGSLRDPIPTVNTGTAGYLGKFVDALDLTSSVVYESAGRIGIGTGATTPLDTLHARFTDGSGSVTGLAVQNMSGSANAYSGMLFYDQNGALAQFQGFNNTSHEYRINNIAAGGSINFMLGSSRFLVRSDGDIQISGNLRKGADYWMHDLGGGQNTALGRQALSAATVNSSGNTAIGYQSMLSSTNAGGNTAIGRGTLRLNTIGQMNVVVGFDAARSLDASYNVAIGPSAGGDKVTGDRNVYLGYGTGGFANNTESNTIRIGDSNNGYGSSYSRFFAGGIRGVTTGQADAVAVVIDSSGQLGTVNSSRRYKDDIQDMGDTSSGLMKLRPVTYRYTQAYANGSRPLDYGLIAEEVAQVYPDLVAHLANGEVETVQYHKINAMLLNEVQKQHRQIEDLTTRLATLERLLRLQTATGADPGRR